jgi:hypothetical protein
MNRWCLLALMPAALLAGCKKESASPALAAPPAPPAASGLRFEDTAAAAGIRFSLSHDGRLPLTILETAGGGAAFLDYDGDGKLDALLVGPHRVGLFRNLGGGRFQDATAGSGLDAKPYWMGCATADYDGDGRVDILLTGYGKTALYRNLGGKFQDVTASAGLKPEGWSLSAAFGDYDGDGRLDVYVTRYVKFDGSTPRVCQVGSIMDACGPEVYDPQFGILYHNLGNGRFEDATRAAGLTSAAGKNWSALFSDFSGDGNPELYVANDMTPCEFYANRHGKFSASGPQYGVAYDASGHIQGAMGCDSGDYDNDGRFDLLVTTYFAQPTSLYHNDGDNLFTEVGTPAGIGAPTMRYVGFGGGFVDVDNDGWLDVLLANGQVRASTHSYDPGQSYAQPLQLFQNAQGHFTEVSAAAGDPFAHPLVGRGVAFGDYDGDGRVDALVCNLEGNALLLRNVSTTANHWLGVRLKATGGNTQGLGARVTVEVGGQRQVREIRTCGGVLSAQEPVAHFGLGATGTVERLTVRWPDGRQTVKQNVAADQLLTLSPDGSPSGGPAATVPPRLTGTRTRPIP